MHQPRNLYLIMTEKCNLKCPFCFMHSSPNSSPAYLSSTVACEAINKIRPLSITFFGGEPLLYPQEIIKIASVYHNDKYITTNLTLKLSDLHIQAINSCDYITTSYSIDRFEHHESLLYNMIDNSRFIKNTLHKPIALIITMTQKQVRIPLEQTLSLFKDVDFDYYIFERLHCNKPTKQHAYDMDKYLSCSLDKIDANKNLFYIEAKKKLQNNLPVVPKHCYGEEYMLYPNGTIINGCSKGALNIPTKQNKCYSCEMFKYCQGDCDAFANSVCQFPKHTTLKIIQNMR